MAYSSTKCIVERNDFCIAALVCYTETITQFKNNTADFIFLQNSCVIELLHLPLYYIYCLAKLHYKSAIYQH